MKDPLRDTTHISFESGDCFLVYPDEPDAKHPETKSSYRLEKLAQGMRDLNKLLFLAEQSPMLREKADRLLEQVKVDYTQKGGLWRMKKRVRPCRRIWRHCAKACGR